MAVGTAVLAGSATGIGTIGMMAAAAIGGAVGSIASQLVGIGLGVQEKFSWGAVASSALAAGIVAGLGSAGVIQTGASVDWKTAAQNAVIRSTVTQGVNILTGQQKQFDWKAVAVSAITAGLMNTDTGKGISSALGKAFGGGLANNYTQDFVGGVVSQGVKQVFYNEGRPAWETIAADFFGQIIGNAVVGMMSKTSAESVLEEKQKQVGTRLQPANAAEGLMPSSGEPSDLNRAGVMLADSGAITSDVLLDLGSENGASGGLESDSFTPGTVSSDVAEMLEPSKFSWSGVADFLKEAFTGVVEWLIGEDFGAAWLDPKKALGDATSSAAQAIRNANGQGLDTQINDNKYGHAMQMSYLQQKFGILGAPLIALGGLGYELYHVFVPGHVQGTAEGYTRNAPFYGITDGQNPVNWLYDTPGDILGNVIGQMNAIFGFDVVEANKVTFMIPGPDYSRARAVSLGSPGDLWERLAPPGATYPYDE
jgi:hypothetical protein